MVPNLKNTKTIYLGIPNHCETEIKYVAEWLFGEVFGFEKIVYRNQSSDFTISVDGDKNRLQIADVFFNKTSTCWLSDATLPKLPLDNIELGDFEQDIPILFGSRFNNGDFLAVSGSCVRLGVDVIGSLFFLMSRYEEVVIPDRDAHERFPASASTSFKSNILNRAIGNEYIDLLWHFMKQLWPNLERQNRRFRVLPSHDIDLPSGYWCEWSTILDSFTNARPRKALREFCQRIKYAWIGLRKQWHRDPNDVLDWIMTVSEAQNVRSAFYYIPEKTHAFDLGMPISHPHVVDQWRRIVKRGHEIGIHPGYANVGDGKQLRSSVERMRDQLKKAEIDQVVQGGRQHFLRWKTPDSMRAWDFAGLTYDSSLGYAEQAGFRCGLCYEYPLYDVVERKKLNVRERPLVIMECTVIDPRYMNLGLTDDAFDKMNELKSICRRHNGDFTILWHNQCLIDNAAREFYKQILRA